MFDAKLFHRLLGEDDPTGWLVAMDMLEETPAGQGHTYDVQAMTSMWRTRSAWWPGLHLAMSKAMADVPQWNESYHYSRAGGAYVYYRSRPKTLLVVAYGRKLWMPGVTVGQLIRPQVWALFARDPKYHRKRLFRLIDELATLHGGGSGGADSTPH